MIQKSINKIRNDGVAAYISAVTRYSRKILEGKAQQVHYNIMYESSAPDPFNTISINPENLEYMTIPAFSFTLERHKTHILDGGWDQRHTNEDIGIHRGNKKKRKLIRVENYDFYRSLKNHFEEDVPWEDTAFYHWAINDARENNIGNRYESKERIHARLEEIDKLYESVQTQGYLSQKDLGHTLPAVNEVQINIGRQGEILFDEGKHRFVISRLLNLQEIPVRVFVRHQMWQKIRQEVSTATSMSQLSETARMNLDHPDIQNINPGLKKPEK